MGNPLKENFYNARTQLSISDTQRLRIKGYKLTHWKGNGDNFYRIEHVRNTSMTRDFQHLKDLQDWVRW